MSNYLTNTEELTAIADAIREKNGTEALLEFPDEFVTAIENISGSTSNTHYANGADNWSYDDDVLLIDYDGTILSSYTKTEFLALSEYPSPPTHQDLTFDGWNWTLQDAQNYVRTNGGLDVGAMYHPTDNKLHLFIHFEDAGAVSYRMVSPLLTNEMVVDWGDGTQSTAADAIQGAYLLHTYANAGDYHIKVDGVATADVPEGLFSGSNQNMIKQIYLPTGMLTIPSNLFTSSFLDTVVIPNTVTTIGTNAFSYTSIRGIVIPNSVTSIAARAFTSASALEVISLPKNLVFEVSNISSYDTKTFLNASALKRITFPPSNIVIPSRICYSANSLRKIIIPEGVTTIESEAFEYTSPYIIYLPSSITTIGEGAFADTGSSLQVIQCDFNYNEVAGEPWGADTTRAVILYNNNDQSYA